MAALCLAAAPAHGHHLVLISEVFPGAAGDEDAEFVELKMYETNQQDFGLGSSVQVFGAGGVVGETIPLDDVAVGQSQRTALVATQQAEARFGVSADAAFDDDELDPAGGAACFNSSVFEPSPIDCVAWGSVVDPPAGAGTPADAIPDGASLERTLARRCSTWLEAVDDTDSSAADFFPSFAPTPYPNAAAPAELPCPNTYFIGVPSRKTRSRKARFRFNSSPVVEDYHCKLDGGPYRRCDSPYERRVDPGRHVMRILAQGELVPARHRWRVLARP